MQPKMLVWKDISITARITLAFTLLVILMGAAVAAFVVIRTADTLKDAEARELKHAFSALEAAINDQGQRSETLSTLIASMPSVQGYMARGDRKALLATMNPIWSVMEKQYAVKQFQFHKPPAISFLRLHKPEKYGDDLSSFRKTVLLANEKHSPIIGIEKGVAGLGIRGVVPISRGNKHLGTVEFGLSFGQEFFYWFKKQFGLDVALHIHNDTTFESFASTFTDTLDTNLTDLNAAFYGTPVLRHDVAGGVPIAVYTHAIADFSGHRIGVIEIAMDRSVYAESLSHTQYVMSGIVAVVLAIGLTLAIWIGRSVTRPVNDAVSVANRIARGELDNRIEITRHDEIGKFLTALKSMNDKLLSIVNDVRVSSDSVGSAAKQIYAGNADLSRRTQEQASALEETAASMEEMTSTVKANADNAGQAYQLVASARDQAEKGGTVVIKTVTAMNEINTSSNMISEIISVIDEIAFQTNLLALNAAVEAARAGEHGRGFAVVATEVRSLAQRSVKAAKEIKRLISDSVEKIKTGSSLVDESGKTLTDIVDAVKKVTDFVAEIAAASQEQYAGIDLVNKAVMQMDESTQQNAALVEEAAAASKSMEEQASHMIELVKFFKTGTQDTYPAMPTSVPAATAHPSASPRPALRPAPTIRTSANDDGDQWHEF